MRIEERLILEQERISGEPPEDRHQAAVRRDQQRQARRSRHLVVHQGVDVPQEDLGVVVDVGLPRAGATVDDTDVGPAPRSLLPRDAVRFVRLFVHHVAPRCGQAGRAGDTTRWQRVERTHGDVVGGGATGDVVSCRGLVDGRLAAGEGQLREPLER
ncbi:MAG: hypothetical protein FJ284_00200 [Planctomycetes bacterium]|nr:hypothetical protein [Planctomycetota bacterium]MBM4057955.1 hypothetical protein [Planctomycetota bacterium]